MGLPLYIAPVESDVQGKSSPKSPAHARSAIRRLRLRSRGNGPAREQQRRVLAAAAAYEDDFTLPSLVLHDYEAPRPPSPPAPTRGAERARQRLHEMFGNRMNTMEALDDRVVERFGERWAELHARSNPSPLLDTQGDAGPSVPSTRHQENAPQQPLAGYHAVPGHTDLPSDLPSHESSSRRSLRRIPRSPPPLRRVRSPEYLTLDRAGRAGRADLAHSILSEPRSSEYSQQSQQIEQQRRRFESRLLSSLRSRYPSVYYPPANLDGLGDRDRSLSPEGDGVWDTLLTTLTPDPQPPSVGSSFASTSASAAASQGAATGSSNTSFTGPDPAEESLLEPQSGCENSDSEGEDEDEDDLGQNTLTRFPLGHRSTRSYANVAAHQSGNDDTFEVLGGIGGMQRIVRNLARREDIPDEWWAEAGLSRTLSRDGTD